MNDLITISSTCFQDAWKAAINKLIEHKWSIWNLVVQIADPSEINEQFHAEMTSFAKSKGLILPDQVAYTIFPFKLYKPGRTRERLYKAYKRYFDYTRTQDHRGWGTYFERMIWYCPSGKKEERFDQLGHIIDSINNRKVNYGSSYYMVIPYPKKQAKRIMGGPCLNYVTIQVEKTSDEAKTVNLLAVYRNHDFLERAYGNYYGLCKLLNYIASETDSNLGVVTCISSHAYVNSCRTDLCRLAT